MNKKHNIVISLPLVWSIRNFILSGITNKLEEKYDVYYAVAESNHSVLLNYNIAKNRILTIKQGKRVSVLFDLLRTAFLHNHNELNYIAHIMQEAGISAKNKNLRTILWKIVLNTFSIFLRSKVIFQFFENIWFFLGGFLSNKEFRKEIVELNPVFILSTTFVVGIEWPLFFIANYEKIPIFTHVLSFDNITSRGYLPVSKFDKYLVWNQKMKDDLIHYYQVEAKKIHITGTPQFDFHNSNNFNMQRSNALTLLGLNVNDRFILYCANHIHHTPKEPQLLSAILESLALDKSLNHFKLIVRLHPLDDYNRWKEVAGQFHEKIHLSIPWSHPDANNTAFGVVTINDMQIFVNQLKYADVVLNIASTIAIDAAMTNTPVICVGFHPSDAKESECYKNYHFSEHYKQIMYFAATPLVLSMDELKKQILTYIQKPDFQQTERNKMAEYYMENYKSGASQKIINTLIL